MGAPGFEFVTYAELNVRNLTVFSSAYPEPPPPETPVQPCPVPDGEVPLIRGRIFRVKTPLDPVSSPGFIPIVRITYTQANAFTPNPALPAEQVDFVDQNGAEFEIQTTRQGPVAVYAILADFNVETQEFRPRRLGFRPRGLSGCWGGG